MAPTFKKGLVFASKTRLAAESAVARGSDSSRQPMRPRGSLPIKFRRKCSCHAGGGLSAFLLASTLVCASESALVGQQCVDDMDCSLQGSCASGSCSCDPGFAGDHCERFNEGKSHLLWPPQAGMPWAAGWGASVRRDPVDGRWHAFASVICQANRVSNAYRDYFVCGGARIVCSVCLDGVGRHDAL